MNIEAIYQQFELPKNLRAHMYRVAAVGEYLATHWQGPTSVDVSLVVSTLLLHDLGNLLKFDLTNGVELFDPSERNVAYWQERQQEMRSRYGTSVHNTTLAMAAEIGAKPRVLELLNGMGSSRLSPTLESTDWELKICTYSDLRVDPLGFVTVEERFSDILSRYFDRGVTHWSDQTKLESEKEKTLQNCVQCLELESQLQAFITVNLQTLPAGELESRSKSSFSVFQF